MDGTAPNFSSYLDSDAVYSVPGEDAGWEQPLKLSGDFYGQVDDVTRGVTLAAAPSDMSSWTPYDEFGGLDIYGRPEDVFKGIHMDIGPPELYLQEPLDMPCLNGLPDRLDKREPAGVVSDSITDTDPGVVRRFTESDRPPMAPSSRLFQFAATTLRMRTVAPFEIGNLVLDFLTTRVKATIAKVNFAKFAIKAEVFIDSSSCLLKARSYEESQDSFCVEFQRRKGDCVAFGEVYRLAVEFLTARLPAFPAGTDVPEIPKACPPGRGLGVVHAEDVTPLLEMADDISRPDLQAESAASLSELAQRDSDAHCLCNARAFDGFKKLLQSSQDNVTFSTACTLSALAQHPEAAPCFANQGILPVIADKIRSTATSELVQRELAQALHKTLASCATELSEKVSEEIRQALADATKDVHIDNATVRSSLLEAYALLECRHPGALGPLSGEATVVQCGGTGWAAEGSQAGRQPPPPARGALVQPCTSSPPIARNGPDARRAAP